MKSWIPIYETTLIGREAEFVRRCLGTGWISSKGEFVGRFEKAFAGFLGGGGATSVCNGTVALHLALHTLGIGPGDEVIVPTLTYIAPVNAIAYVGAKPVFVDALPTSWNLDVSQIEAKITAKTKAILAVHLYGAVCDMIALRKICRQHRLFLVEDAAEAFGSKLRDKFAGTWGDISTFSFFGNKTITTGEGGMVVSPRPSLVRRAAYLKSQAVSRLRQYWHDEIGFNHRMTNICAAIGLAQLEHANSILRAKRRLAGWYRQALEGAEVRFQDEPAGSIHSQWLVSILVESRSLRNRVRRHLAKHGVETRPLFHPAHTMPVFYEKRRYPVAEDLGARGLSLPSYPQLTQSQVARICRLILEVI